MREMKNSCIEFIGKVPLKWGITKTKYLFDVVNGATPKSDNPQFWDGEVCWITPAEMSENIREIVESKRTITFDGLNSCGTTVVPRGSIIISTRAPIGQVCLAGVNLCTNQGCKSLVRKEECTQEYYYYYFSVQAIVLNMLGRGTTFLELSSYALQNFSLPLPDNVTQTRITSFLDNKCAQIDRIIEQQQSEIEKLKEYKQSVITEAVTKGLNYDVLMKDSNIEWIGMIPEHWGICSIKYWIKSIESGVSVNAAYYPATEGEYGVMKTSCVYGNKFSANENKCVNVDEYDLVSCPIKSHTIIVSRMNTPELVGACGYVENDICNLFLPDRLWQISFLKGVSVKYLWYYLSGSNAKFYISSIATGTSSSMKNISQGQFGSTKITYLKFDEQNEIVCYLDKLSDKIDSIIVSKYVLIEKLLEYKKSLIYEAVTGKLEV